IVEEQREAHRRAVIFGDQHLRIGTRAEQPLGKRLGIAFHLVAQLLVFGEIADEAEDKRRILTHRRAYGERHARSSPVLMSDIVFMRPCRAAYPCSPRSRLRSRRPWLRRGPR